MQQGGDQSGDVLSVEAEVDSVLIACFQLTTLLPTHAHPELSLACVRTLP
jgi:hypothetical protein